MSDQLKILFMGSPEFAAHSLARLIKDGFQIVGVITVADKKQGRGQSIGVSAVKQIALNNNLKIYQPSNLKDPDFVKEIKSLNPDLGVVVAFRMLPEVIWNMPVVGTVNLHASLLPNYRGAAPINWAIINGESKTGLTTFFLKHEIDTGDILMQEELEIEKDMTAGQLHDLMMETGAELLSESVRMISSGEYKTKDQQSLMQNQSNLKNAPKIFKEDSRILWDKPASEVHNLIRGLSPYPGAWGFFLTLNGKEVIFKIYKSSVSDISSKEKTKTLISQDKESLMIGTSDYYINILDIQIQGKKRMNIAAFLNGFSPNDVTLK